MELEARLAPNVGIHLNYFCKNVTVEFPLPHGLPGTSGNKGARSTQLWATDNGRCPMPVLCCPARGSDPECPVTSVPPPSPPSPAQITGPAGPLSPDYHYLLYCTSAATTFGTLSLARGLVAAVVIVGFEVIDWKITECYFVNDTSRVFSDS